MTAPLHHLNQMYLHLPAINGQVAAQASASEEMTRISRQAQDQAYRRDLVEVVAETTPGQAPGSIRRDYEPLAKTDLRSRPRGRTRAVVPRTVKGRKTQEHEPDLLVDVRV
ncbi:MAG: hypothetical protein LBP22_12615 [Deltaproteobacteria bacterium]|jgi:hypothetical protein|nr:hypothetical protein [Deltaproteobacteria bacterium]